MKVSCFKQLSITLFGKFQFLLFYLKICSRILYYRSVTLVFILFSCVAKKTDWSQTKAFYKAYQSFFIQFTLSVWNLWQILLSITRTEIWFSENLICDNWISKVINWIWDHNFSELTLRFLLFLWRIIHK